MEINIKFTDKDKWILYRILATMLFISNTVTILFSFPEIDKHLNESFEWLFAFWVIVYTTLTAIALFNYYGDLARKTKIK